MGGCLLGLMSLTYAINYFDGQRQLATVGTGAWCGTCLSAVMSRIHATPERDLPMALFTAGAAAVCGIQATRLRIAAKLAER